MIKAVIFDMDGVISDTQVLHAETLSKVCSRQGIIISPDEITARFAGVKAKEMFSILAKEQSVGLPAIAGLIDEYTVGLMSASEGHVMPVPGTIAFIDKLVERGMTLGLASSSGLEYIKLVLKELGLTEKIKVIASGQEVARGKPAPDVFLLAAERLGVAPENCLVIEDAVSGMTAAKYAGMKCVGLVRQSGGEYPADVIVDNLEKLDWEIFQ